MRTLLASLIWLSDDPARLTWVNDDPARLTWVNDDPARLTRVNDDPARLTWVNDDPACLADIHQVDGRRERDQNQQQQRCQTATSPPATSSSPWSNTHQAHLTYMLDTHTRARARVRNNVRHMSDTCGSKATSNRDAPDNRRATGAEHCYYSWLGCLSRLSPLFIRVVLTFGVTFSRASRILVSRNCIHMGIVSDFGGDLQTTGYDHFNITVPITVIPGSLLRENSQ